MVRTRPSSAWSVCIYIYIYIKNIALESPEQLGRTERHGGMWKNVAKRTVHSQEIKGLHEMKMMTFNTNKVLNDGTNIGGWSPSQWVLGKYPRDPGSIMNEDEFMNLGVISERFDPTSAMQRNMQLRQAAKLSFAKEDCSARVQRAILRQAAPIQKDYQTGDLISY